MAVSRKRNEHDKGEGQVMPEALSEDLAEALRRAIANFVRAVREKTNTDKSAQDEALVLLERDGAMNIAALAKRRNVTHQTMRLVVAQLEQAQLIERQADPADRRSQLFFLSDLGREVLHRDRNTRASKIGSIMDKTLSAQDRETLRESIVLLDRMSAAARE